MLRDSGGSDCTVKLRLPDENAVVSECQWSYNRFHEGRDKHQSGKRGRGPSVPTAAVHTSQTAARILGSTHEIGNEVFATGVVRSNEDNGSTE